jgi:hypothetical protein
MIGRDSFSKGKGQSSDNPLTEQQACSANGEASQEGEPGLAAVARSLRAKR